MVLLALNPGVTHLTKKTRKKIGATTFKILLTVSRNGCAANKDGLPPWDTDKMMARIDLETIGKTVIMGRKTHMILGTLPDRQNIVLTRNGYRPVGCDKAHSFKEALALAEHEVFVIGSTEVYIEAFAMPEAKEVLLTMLEYSVDAEPTVPSPFSIKGWRTLLIFSPNTSQTFIDHVR